MPLGITLGAQIGVVVPSVLVFGRLPLVSIPANLLAVPVAGAVMLYGLPAALLAGAVPPLAPVVMLPALVGTRWVDTVAQVAALVEPEPPWVWLGWVGRGHVARRRACRVGRHDRVRIEVAMTTHLLTGDDESILRTAVVELVDRTGRRR